MDPTRFDREREMNRRAFAELREEVRLVPVGRYVVLAFGRIVAEEPNFAEAKAAVERLVPAPEHSVIFPAGSEPAFEPFHETHVEYR